MWWITQDRQCEGLRGGHWTRRKAPSSTPAHNPSPLRAWIRVPREKFRPTQLVRTSRTHPCVHVPFHARPVTPQSIKCGQMINSHALLGLFHHKTALRHHVSPIARSGRVDSHESSPLFGDEPHGARLGRLEMCVAASWWVEPFFVVLVTEPFFCEPCSSDY